MTNWPEPRDIVRTGNFPYVFKIDKDFVYASGWKLDQPFDSQWLAISTDGTITVKANETGYAWDGCTPKWSVLNLVIIGTPDGHIDYRTMKPFCFYASLVHDALYQYLDSVPVPKKDIDLLFLDMLGDFKLRKLYHFFVKHVGGRGVIQRGL
ncbi:hypothetical protein [Enterovibrio baiacu]|uniref:hypothetical protein n=1 Tax=Enterovibrio baiacu TaxID=2491023 RepID=UPI003D108F37